ncbi:MAG: suppressor of fused domain protein [Myxococcaceae bacterium]|nr:suppressor of fused domain protein [Myxococcaceae bacterium]MCI0672915.1 suppressor of fused domain protein [Myxococcaceae bacterium]
MNAPDTEASYAQWYEQAWADRDEGIYPQLFPTIRPDVFTLDQTDSLQAWLESDIAEVGEADPAWGAFGVRVSPPSEGIPVWTYVTSGLSNPFTVAPGGEYSPEGPSGIGYELVIHTPEEARWPILRLLDMMAYNLVCLRAFAPGGRFQVEGTLDGGDSKLTGFVFLPSPLAPEGFQLPSGRVQLLTAVGVTRNEMAFARSNGVDKLLDKLDTQGTGIATVPERDEVKLSEL